MSTNGFFDVQRQLAGKKMAAKVARPAPGKPSDAMSVSQLTTIIDKAIRNGVPASVLVRGEISNCKLHGPSGHLYFTLKDSRACIDGIMYRDNVSSLKFEVLDGMELIIDGKVQVFAPKGRYQLCAERMQPVGQGALELAFRQMQAKLAAEGLFDSARKKPIPRYPRRIAMVTSLSTAALQDILKVLRRFAWLTLMVYHVPVQGDGSGAKIANALRHLDLHAAKLGGIDVILLARGGGSLEDLWAFNEEAVARAVAGSTIPIVTGIGHEVDCSIADLVADHHAHTPTEAAQTITAYWRTAEEAVEVSMLRLRRAIDQNVIDARQRLQSIERHEIFRRPLDRVNALQQLLDDRQRTIDYAIARRLQSLHRRLYDLDARLQARGPLAAIQDRRSRLDQMQARLSTALNEKLRANETRLSRAMALLQECHPRHQIRLFRQRLSSQETRAHSAMGQQMKITAARLETYDRQLRALGPEQVLKRGYTITTIKKTGAMVRSIRQINGGERLVTRAVDGTAESIADDPRQLPLFE